MTRHSPITDAELERRWSVARGVMEAQGLDVLVMQAREDWMGGYVRWFTDVPAGNGYPRTVLFYRDRPMTVVEMGAFGTDRALDRDPVHRGVGRMLGTPSFVSIHYSVRYDTELAVGDLQARGARRVGLLAPGALPHDLVRGLEAAQFDLVDATDALDAAKAVKSPEERALARDTALLQDRVFAEVCDYIRPGRTDRDVMAFAEATGRRLGSDQGIYLGLSARVGAPSRFMGRHFQTRELEKGDHLSILIEVNGPGEQFLNTSARSLRGAPVFDKLAIDAPLDEAFVRVRSDLSPLFINKVDVSGGNAAPVQCNIQIAPLAGHPGHILVMMEPRQIADRLGRAYSVTSAAKSAIGMAEMLAHEIKNPLAGINGAAQLLSMNLDASDQ